MRKLNFVRVLICVSLTLGFVAIPSVLAACDPGDTGGAGIDVIVCHSPNLPAGDVSGGAGPDTILIAYTVSTTFDIIGDNSTAVGGDVIIIDDGATVGAIYGDKDTDGGIGGGDKITMHGYTLGEISGDYLYSGAQADGGNDFITISDAVDGYVAGDDVRDNGGDDVITLLPNAVVSLAVMGDYTANGNGGDDNIVVHKFAQITDGLIGDNVGGDGGNDTLTVFGTVDIDVWGDRANNGGDDVITIGESGLVKEDIFGDNVSETGGKDSIIIEGTVNKRVYGDGAKNGASDTIIVTETGIVKDSVVGDQANFALKKDFITIYGKVLGSVSGDNISKAQGNAGGWDNIKIFGTIGSANGNGYVSGDSTAGNGGNDYILIGEGGKVFGSVAGDEALGKAGQDKIVVEGIVTETIRGDVANNSNAKDQITVRETGIVNGNIMGDGSDNNKAGGWDVINIIGGQVDGDVMGDWGKGKGGNDFIAIRMNGLIKNDLIGDYTYVSGDGGNDTLSVINGTVKGDVIGDDVVGDGGNDKINLLVAGTVEGNIIGDDVGADKLGGDDSIFVAGTVGVQIIGDHPTKSAFAGADTIQTTPSAVIAQGIVGDNAKGKGGDDTFKINGRIFAVGVIGDQVNGKGGNDNISIFSLGDVIGGVTGDDSNGAGGNDTILVDGGGKVTGHVWGDYSKGNGGNDKITIEGTVTGNVVGDHHKAGSTANGGDDTIIVEQSGLVQGSVFGDDSPGNGGDDKIDIKGKVNGNVLGDKVGGAGGNDVIRIFASATVGGNVCGKNNCNNNPGDNVVFLDESTTPSFDSADTIIVAGKVLGNVIAGLAQGNSDDTVVVVEGAEIGGTVYAGDETDGDSFIYVENIINEEKTISEVVNGVTQKDGKVTVNGATYTLDDVETVAGAVGQIACFGMDYRMNKASDGCAARSGAEKDAIQWHLDNPGNDGRLPGLEGCAVYAYGNGLRIYEIMDGAEGELVAEIWGDILSDAPATNELLGATANGNIVLYHLASGELQVECRNLVDGKTQVRVLSDLAGTVTNAYDKG